MALKTKITTVPDRYKSKLTEHIFKSPDYSLREKGQQMVRGKDGKFQNPLKVTEPTEPTNGDRI